MKQKLKKSSKSECSYYLPLPYAMAIHRVISKEETEQHLFKGMQVHFRKMEIPSMSIAIMAYYNDSYNYIGFVPKGMLTRIEEVLNFEDDIVVSLEQVFCPRLANTMWITIDELPSIEDLGI